MHDLILVIEPDTIELRRLREILSREGFSITTALDRETALQICKRLEVRFVLGNAEILGFGSKLQSEIPNENKE